MKPAESYANEGRIIAYLWLRVSGTEEEIPCWQYELAREIEPRSELIPIYDTRSMQL